MTTRTLGGRVAKLEARHRPTDEPRAVHRLILESEAEQAEKIAALITSGEAQEDDMFIVHMIVDPEENLRKLGVI